MNEVAVREKTDLALKESPNHLIALALEKGADPDTLSKLMDLQERWQAGQARKAYVSAMTGFKQEAPAVLKKGDRVDFTSAKGRTAYNYANLGSIVQEITVLLGKHDLSASWMTAQDGSNVTVTCHITHIAGHRESVVLTGPADDSGNKNRIQAVGSTVTYLQRYTLLAALGLATGEDDDGRQGDKTGMKPPESKSTASPDATGSLEATGEVSNVMQKSGGTKDKPWTKYSIFIGETAYNTFDKTIAENAKAAKEVSAPVKITYTVKEKFGNEIETLVLHEEETAPETVNA
jgi:hypothetical protein